MSHVRLLENAFLNRLGPRFSPQMAHFKRLFGDVWGAKMGSHPLKTGWTRMSWLRGALEQCYFDPF